MPIDIESKKWLNISEIRNLLAIVITLVVIISGAAVSLSELTTLAQADTRLEKQFNKHIVEIKGNHTMHVLSNEKHLEQFKLLEKSLQKDRVQAARMEERQKALQRTLESQGKTTDLILQQLRSLRFRSNNNGSR